MTELDEADIDQLNLEARQIEVQHRVMQNIKASQGTLQEMLNQPYVAPTMEYSKHEVLPKEVAYIQKAASIAKNKKMNDYQVKNHI